ncbi:SIMPL domain-containing protein [Halorubellus salinus]|uniref:SIMPL domain-containing protein n=1 Tax=Halorubellus salinus TaxID=755309 RepID=UPI001D098B51|nr:SIMPL domain-containing protein [Halorubellus salinus]
MPRTVEVDGRASIDVAPDTLVVSIEIEAGDSTAARARDLELDRRTTLRDALPDVVDDTDVTVTGRYVGESTAAFDEGVTGDYTARTTLDVRCAPNVLDDVVVTTTDTGGSVESVTPIVSEGRREELREELVTAATESAREQADHIAETLDRPITDVVSISTSEPGPLDSFADEIIPSGVSANYDPGPVELAACVTATFELGPADDEPDQRQH